jgi:hypothetical protein
MSSCQMILSPQVISCEMITPPDDYTFLDDNILPDNNTSTVLVEGEKYYVFF